MKRGNNTKTKFKKSEKELSKTKRAFRTLSKCSRMIVHAANETDLLRNVCKIIVRLGGYRLAWVGYAEHDEIKSVRPVAQAGYEKGYLEKINVTWADTEQGRGPTGTAIRTGKPAIAKNIPTDPSFAPWRSEALKRGYASSIALPLKTRDKTLGALNIYADEPDAFDVDEVNLLIDMADNLAYGIMALRMRRRGEQAQEELKKSHERLKRALKEAIHALASAAEKRDPYIAGHQERVTRLACSIAREMGLSESKIEGLNVAGLVHDIGKIQIPAEILSKPTKLSEFEIAIIQSHPQVGYDILKGVEFPWPVADIVLQHHERMLGDGYPAGLDGENIILEARILGVADVIEAMSSHRPYRPALGIGQALQEIRQNRGILYDPVVVDICLELFLEKGFRFNQEC